MATPSAEQDTRIDDLLRAVAALERRVAALEQGAAAPVETVSLPLAAQLPGSEEAVEQATNLLPLLGRALLGLAAAYLLRGLAESGSISALAGVGLGAAFAFGWLASAVRVAVAGALPAGIHAITGALILAPMLWETTVRFQSSPPLLSALLLAAFASLGLAVAWKRNVRIVATVATLASLGAGAVLLVGTRDVVPFTAALIAMACAVEVSACRDHWLGLRWIAAATADLSVIVLTLLLTRRAGLPDGYAPIPLVAALSCQGALLTVYLGSTMIRTLGRGLNVTWFETGQAALAFVIAIGGALRLTQANPWGAMVLGWFALLAGVVCYVVAFTFLDRHTGRDRNLYVYGLFALLLVVTAAKLLLAGPPEAYVFSALALAAALANQWVARSTLRVHGAAYLLCGLLTAGLAGWNAAQFQAAASPPLPPAAAAVTALAVFACYALFWRASRGHTPGWSERVALVVAAGAAAWTLAAGAVALCSTLTAHAGLLPAWRTLVLAGLAVALAWAAPRWQRAELRALLYAALAVVTIKIVRQDLPQSRNLPLFVSLLAYGCALMLVPRLLRRAKP